MRLPYALSGYAEPLTVTAHIDLRPYDSCTGGAAPIDLVMLIDASASMMDAPITQAVAGATRLLDTLNFDKDRSRLRSSTAVSSPILPSRVTACNWMRCSKMPSPTMGQTWAAPYATRKAN